jgi:MFS family permease
MTSSWTAAGPSRTLILAQLANTLGNGAFVTTSALYFTRVVGFSAGQFGLGLSIAGIAGLLAGVPFGHLADRRGPRNVAASLMALAGVAVVAYLFLQSFLLFVVTATLFALFDRGGHAARQALIAAVRSGDDLVAVRAQLRAVTNVGLGCGAALGGVALLWDTREAYLVAIAADAVSFLVCAALMLRLPQTPPSAVAPVKGEPRLAVLRDRPYALLAVLNMLMLLYAPLLDVVIPLWIAGHTDAPKALTSVIFLVNTVAVVLFQVRVSKGIASLGRSVWGFRVSGFALLAACVVFASSDGRSALVASVLLLVAAGLHVYGEMVQSAASWVVAFDLAPAHRQGQYQGLFNTGMAATQMFAPAALVFLLIGWGPPGWYVLGVVLLLAGLAMAPAVRWAVRTREGAEEGAEKNAEGHDAAPDAPDVSPSSPV